MKYSNKELLQDIVTFVKPYKKYFWIGTISRFAGDLVWLIPPWALSEIITFATEYSQGDSLQYFWQLMMLVAVVALFHFVNHDVCKYYIYQVAQYIDMDARVKTIKHLFSLDIHWHQKENTGNKMQRIINGGESLNRMMRIYVDLIIESTINSIAITLILFVLDPLMSIALIFFFITYFMLSLKLTKDASHQANLVNIEMENFNGTSFESLNNVFTVKTLGFFESIFLLLQKNAQSFMVSIKKRIFLFRKRQMILNIYQEIFRQGMLLFVVLMVFNGGFEVGIIAMIVLYFNKMRESADEFSRVAHEFVLAKIAIIRMKELLDEKPKVDVSGDKKFPENWKKVQFKDVSFSYEGKDVLTNFNLTIQRGEKIGIVGVSGAGKSTLMKLFLKLYNNYSGDILFNNTALKDIQRNDYLNHFSVVLQDTEVFNLSLQDNIALQDIGEKVDQEALDDAIRISHVQNFLPKMSQGLKTLIGEKGVKLSGGERQRVGIARAIYKKPEILFLDEATSHLDADSEQNIQEALHEVFENITAVVIAHRLSTLKEMDRIIVMDQGRVVEEGTFDQLIQQKSTFHMLWEKQKI